MTEEWEDIEDEKECSENNKPPKSGENVYVPPSEELCGKELNANGNTVVQSVVVRQILQEMGACILIVSNTHYN